MITPLRFFIATSATSATSSTVQGEFVKTSVSLPADLINFLKSKSQAGGGVPISRLVAQAIKEQAARDRKNKGGKK